MIIKPVKNYILLEEIKNSLETDSGIVLTEDTDQEPTYMANVLECGVGETPPMAMNTTFASDQALILSPFPFKNGDTVLIQKHLFNEITVDKKHYLIGKSDGIMAVINAD